MSTLEEIWCNLTRDLPEQKHDWWNKIIENLSHPQRKYHNLQLLHFQLDLYQSVKHLIKNPRALEYALFFNYRRIHWRYARRYLNKQWIYEVDSICCSFEYEPRNADTHLKNIEHFKQFALDCCVPLESKQVCDVISLLECTSSHMTEEHMTKGLVGRLDKHYFLDIDMSVLGSPSEQYQNYAERVQQEYSFLDKSAYSSLRVKVLQSFLQIPNIFATEEFRSKYEEQARRNIHQEISLLM